MSSIRPPNQFLIVNDKTFTEAEVTSVSSYAKLKLSSTYAKDDNNGNLSSFCVDNNPSIYENYELRIQNSGSLEEATYIWGKENAQYQEWNGEDDRRFISYMDSADITSKVINATGVYSHVNKCVFLYYNDENNQIGIRYKELSYLEDYNAWQTETFEINNTDDNYRADNLSDQSGVLDVTELDNGKILMVVKRDNDLDLYISIDGINFNLYAPQILSRFQETYKNLSNVKICSSGSYVRIIGIIEDFDDSFTFFSIVSSDRGSSWIKNEFTKTAFQKEPTGDERFSFDIVKFDENGTFILSVLGTETEITTETEVVVGTEQGLFGITKDITETVTDTRTDVNTNRYETYVATGISTFSEYNKLRLGAGLSPNNIYLCNHSDWIIALIVSITDRGDVMNIPSEVISAAESDSNREERVFNLNTYEYQMLYIDKSSNISNTRWQSLNGTSAYTAFFKSITGFMGSSRLLPTKGKLFSSTAGFYWFHGLRDKEQPLDFAHVKGGSFTIFGNWSSRTIVDKNVENFCGYREKSQYKFNKHYPTGRTYIPQWNTHIGSPSAGIWGSFESIWKLNRDSVGTYGNWDSSRYRISSLSNAQSSDYFYFEYVDPSFYDTSRTVENPFQNSVLESYNSVGLTNFGSGIYRNKEESPDRNWCFVPFYNNEDDKRYKNSPHGSCVVWRAKFDQQTLDTSTDDYMVVGIKSYVKLGDGFNKLHCTVRHGENQLVIYDQIANAPLTTLTPDTGIYGTNCFSDYWEFRWAWYPIAGDLTHTRCMLMCRPNGSSASSDKWISTEMIKIAIRDNYVSGEILSQRLYFGHVASRSGEQIKSYWKNVSLHANNDLGVFSQNLANIAPLTNMFALDSIRGRRISNNPDIFEPINTTKIVWGGSSGNYDDRFFAEMEYDYPASNINSNTSPRIHYRSAETLLAVGNSPEIVFAAKKDEVFFHDSISIINTNVREVEISYSMGSGYGSPETVSMLRLDQGRISDVNENLITVEFANNDLFDSEIISNEYTKYYLRTDVTPAISGVANTYSFEIIKSFKFGNESAFLINTDNMNPNINVNIVGSSVSVYSDRGYTEYKSSAYGKYMKIKLKDANETAEGYARLGNIIVGNKFSFDTALNWEFTDTQKANQTRFRTRSGIQWSYNQGPAERQLSVRMIGDVTQQDRKELRNQLESINGYGESNLVFITEPMGRVRDSIFHGMTSDETTFQNQGWFYDETNGRWYPVGDLDITFIEIT